MTYVHTIATKKRDVYLPATMTSRFLTVIVKAMALMADGS